LPPPEEADTFASPSLHGNISRGFSERQNMSEQNPPTLNYQPPPTDPAAAVSGPAIFLMVVGGIGIAVQLLSMALNLLGAGLGAAAGRQGIAAMMQGGLGIVFNIIGMIVGVVILLGAMKMKKLQSYGFAMAASIVAMVPCVSPCCLLGLPAGIWAIVILTKPEVKAAFQNSQPGFPVS
jgi:hypothetical protein